MLHYFIEALQAIDVETEDGSASTIALVHSADDIEQPSAPRGALRSVSLP